MWLRWLWWASTVGTPDIWLSLDLLPLWFNRARSPKAKSALVQELMAYDGFTLGLIQLISTSVGASSLTFVGLPNSPRVQRARQGPILPTLRPRGLSVLASGFCAMLDWKDKHVVLAQIMK